MNITKNKLSAEPHSSPRELEYKSYQLGLLNEYLRELTFLEKKQDILEHFLLMCMGAVGTDKSLLLVFDQAEEPVLYSRGFTESRIQVLREQALIWGQKHFSREDIQKDLLPKQVLEISANQSSPGHETHLPWPDKTDYIVRWTLDAGCFGFLALGTKLDGKHYSDPDRDFLPQLVEILMDSLQLAGSRAEVDKLNKELTQKNRELIQALNQTEKSRENLDRQVFHFKALSDTSRELSAILEKDKLLDAFMLMVLGVMSSRMGCLILYDEQSDKILSSFRGQEAHYPDSLPHSRIKDLIASLYPSEDHYTNPEYRVQNVKNGQLQSIFPEPGLEMAVAFSLDRDRFGIIGVSSRLVEEGYSDQEQELLISLTHNFLPALANAYSFETIQDLNLDLGQRNFELSRTIEELKKSHETINILQKARNRVRDLIHMEASRLERVRIWDFVFIIAVTLLISLPYNSSSPGGISLAPAVWSLPEPEMIETAEAAAKLESGTAVIVDARPNEFFQQERIRDAINLPSNLFDFMYMMHFAGLDPGKEIIVYGRNVSRRYDEKVAFELSQRGHEQVLVMPGGVKEWKARGLPVAP
jgi:rhodanese-related sulfurtransferase